MIERAIIQATDGGAFPNAALCAAFLGFKARGREVFTLSPHQIEYVAATPTTLVFGGVSVVRDYLARLGCSPPSIDYPDPLHPFLGRRIETTTLEDIRHRYNEAGSPVFIKPVQHKLFVGQQVSRFRDLIPTSHLDGNTPVYCVEHLEFLSEWRLYCRDDRAVGLAHYKGDPLLLPDVRLMQRALEAYSIDKDRPRACALDFGVVRGGSTLLVEVNDMIALGSYGLDPVLYSELIELRWEQITSSPTV